jgi:hypothetical protein
MKTRPDDFIAHIPDETGGITIREHFAILAMQGLLNSMNRQSTWISPNDGYVDYIIENILAKEAVACADALIEQLNMDKE